MTPSGTFFLNDLPLQLGSNSIVLVVTTQDGNTASSTIAVTRQGEPGFAVGVDVAEDVGRLEVRLTASALGILSAATVEFDIDGDGTPDYVAPSIAAADVIFTLEGAGLRNSRITFKDQSGAVLQVISKRLFVWGGNDLYPLVRGVYDGLLSRLRGSNISAALNLVAGQGRQQYGDVFNQISDELIAAVDEIGVFTSLSATLRTAEGVVLRQVSGESQAFLIYFVKGKDGIWRIESM